MHNEDKDNRELPGHWIDHPDRDWAFLTRMLLDEILDQLNEARIVLPLFKEKSRANTQTSETDRRLCLVYAKSFVYALDAAAQIVKVIGRQKQLPTGASNQCKRFLAQFGELHEFRNSLQHIEDRLRGIGRNGKPIPSHLLALGGLRNYTYFGVTISDGRYVEIEISDSVLIQAYSITEDLIWCFDWLGPDEIRLERPRTDA
ncbi:MAG: hypothetical protein C4583_18010 [Anaerolineaceae bacterium]|nr:MAG: hypothetical protein C4583_18010 [Anaerolineaceae bacterium]